MKAAKIIFGCLFIAGMTLFYTGCKKDSATNNNTTKQNTNLAADNSLAENTFDNVKLWSDQAMASHALKSSLQDTVFMGTCVLATLDLTSVPYALTINFGTSNCQCADGKYRRGKILVTFSGSYWMPGTVISYGFDNYFVNDNQVLGTKTVTNMGLNNAGHPWWQVVVAGQIIKANNGGTFTWNSTYQYEWTTGYNTPWEWWDDVYQLTGNANGIAADGKSYSLVIVTPLVKKLNCQWVSGGTMNIQPQDQPLITLDYGTGICDDILLATINGQTYTIHMN